jgi:AraC-like DNA-binding protein
MSREAPSARARAPNRPIAYSSVEVSDILSDALRTLGLQSRVFCRSSLGAPWSLQIRTGNYAHFHVIERGAAFLHRAGCEPFALAAGDLVVLMRGEGHQLSHSTKPHGQVTRVPGSAPGHCTVLQKLGGQPIVEMLCGAFEFARSDAHLLVSLLPEFIHIPGGASEPLTQLLRSVWEEIQEPRIGSGIILARFTDAIFVQAVRIVLERAAGAHDGWLRALGDPKIAAALGRLHADPAAAWTVRTLADAAGMSRAPFAARFASLLGTTPLAYVTQVRVARAAEDLRTGNGSLKEIAGRAGYESEAAFSKVFRRIVGVTPGTYRSASRTAIPRLARRR